MHSCIFGRELLLGRLEPIAGGATGLIVRFVARRTARNAGCYIADGGLVRKMRRGVPENALRPLSRGEGLHPVGESSPRLRAFFEVRVF